MKADKKKKTVLILGLITTGTLIGFFLGRATSPDGKKPETARWTLVMYGKWTRVDAKTGRIDLQAGSRTYSYTTHDQKVSVRCLAAEELAARAVPKREFDSDLDKFLALAVAPPAETGIWVGLSEAMGKTGRVITVPERVLLGVATLGGGAVGYYLGHKSEPDYDDGVFEKELTTNIEFWKQMEENFKACYHMRVVTTLSALSDIDDGSKAHKSSNAGLSKSMQQFLSYHPEIDEQVKHDPLLLEYLKTARKTATQKKADSNYNEKNSMEYRRQ